MTKAILSILAATTALALATGCKRSAPTGHSHGDGATENGGDHGHEHEEKTAQITVWTDRYEVFAEHQAPVAGQATTFITHVTDLETLEPRREGPVRFVFQQADNPPIEHLQAGPARAGIYLPGLTFPTSGKWGLRLAIQGETVDLGIVEVYPDADSAAHADVPEAPEGISFLKEQQWKILTRTELVAQDEVTETIHLAGTVAPKPGSMASVVSPVAGRLQLPPNKPLPIPGQQVEEGALLVLLQPTFSEQTSRLLEAESQAIRAKAGFDQATLVFERVKRLAAEEAKSGRELQEAEFALKSSQAEYDAAVALQSTYRKLSPRSQTSDQPLDLKLIEIRSPIAGIISQISFNFGELISPNQVLFTVLNPEAVWIEARVPESRSTQLQEKPAASLALNGSPGKNFLTFVYAGMQIDPATRSVPLVFESNNTNQLLRIGQTVSLQVQSRRVEKGIVIPESAIVDEDGKPFAFVQLSGETFEKRDLVLGVRGDGVVQVTEGLRERERVVTKGAYAVRLASVSSVIPAHGHAH